MALAYDQGNCSKDNTSTWQRRRMMKFELVNSVKRLSVAGYCTTTPFPIPIEQPTEKARVIKAMLPFNEC